MLRWFIVLAAAMITALSGVTTGNAAPPGVSEQDKAFLVGAHQDNLTEIQGGRIAERQAGKQSIKDAGRKLAENHTALDDQLKPVAERLGVGLPSRPSEEQQAELRQLAAKSGAAFDQAWIDAQVKGHRKALVSLDKELSSGSSQEVKDLAQDARPVVQEHLNLIESIRGGE
ncbi:MAG: DUF4142 domain-containing protein [Microbispora sp.]|nr:DUF4142 domain-containing protein [Microbispora sp.]